LLARSVGERGERIPAFAVGGGEGVYRVGEIRQPSAFRTTAKGVTASDGDFFFAGTPVVVLHAEVRVPDFGSADIREH
jgi:hypothetical protein